MKRFLEWWVNGQVPTFLPPFLYLGTIILGLLCNAYNQGYFS